MSKHIVFAAERRKRRLPRVEARRRLVALVVMSLVAGLMSTQLFAGAESGASHTLMVSASPDRSSAQTLHGNAVRGDIHVFVAPETDVSTVAFHVDDPGLKKKPFNIEKQAPWDLAGTIKQSRHAYSFDSRQLADGTHVITAVVQRANHTKVTISSTFTVANNALYNLWYSTSPDRSASQPLAGATLRGSIYVFSTPDTDVGSAEFTLDGAPAHTDTSAPFDLLGGDTSAARALETTTLANGVHEAGVKLQVASGASYLLAAQFSVQNQTSPDAKQSNDPYSIVVSKSSDRSNPVPLDGAAVDGKIFVFTTPDAGVKSGEFTIDGKFVRSESNAPFDFAGGDVATARAYDTSKLSSGEHVIGAKLALSDGTTTVIEARFRVGSATSEPAPTTTTTAAPAPAPSTTTTTAAPAPTPSPSPSAWPNATNTGPIGAGLSYSDLKASGSISITTNGAVIDKLDVSGAISVYADNVTIKRTRIRHNGAYGVRVMSGSTGLLIEDVEIVGTSDSAAQNIGSKHYTCRRCNLSGAADGVKANGFVTVEASFIHSLRRFSGSHNDGGQHSGSTNPGPVVFRGNAIWAPYQTSTAAIIAATTVGYIDGLYIEGNLLHGGSYSVYAVDKNNGYGDPKQTYIRNNTFVKGSTGLYRVCVEAGYSPSQCNVRSKFITASSSVTVSGNQFQDGTSL